MRYLPRAVEQINIPFSQGKERKLKVTNDESLKRKIKWVIRNRKN